MPLSRDGVALRDAPEIPVAQDEWSASAGLSGFAGLRPRTCSDEKTEG